ncbi:MAG: transcription initiation factor IIB family protein [Candidatus Heimdallarchaeota archaeon]
MKFRKLVLARRSRGIKAEKLASETERKIEVDICPECRQTSFVVDTERGETICVECGTVLKSRMIDYHPEWRKDDSEKVRAGPALTVLQPDYGLRTHIPKYERKDAKGKKISSGIRRDFARRAMLDEQSSSSLERNLRIALRELKRLSSQMELPGYVERAAAQIYRRALKKDLIRGRTINGVMAASIYLASKHNGLPHSLKDFTEPACLDLKVLSRFVRALIIHLDMPYTSVNFSAIVSQLAQKLKLSMTTQRVANEILKISREKGLTLGKNPAGLAAAALYIAGLKTRERRTQQELAAASKTTPVTIRNRFKEMIKQLNIHDIESDAQLISVET